MPANNCSRDVGARLSSQARELEAGGFVREGAEVLAAALVRQKERDDAQLGGGSREYMANYD